MVPIRILGLLCLSKDPDLGPRRVIPLRLFGDGAEAMRALAAILKVLDHMPGPACV